MTKSLGMVNFMSVGGDGVGPAGVHMRWRVCPLRIGVAAHTERVTSVTPRLRPAAVRRLPSGPGVYRFRDSRDRVLYVGRATALRQRVGSYWSDLRDRRHLRRMVASVARIEAVACDSVHEAAWLERNLLETSMPPWNPQTAAAGPLATTPAVWSTFATVNAELAATLAG